MSSGERFFRCYSRHCIEPDNDTLFNLLNSIHSLNDRLRKEVQANFFNCPEFICLKALRNLFHHETELIHDVRIITAKKLPPFTTDLLYLCLVPRALVERAIKKIDNKWLRRDEEIIRRTLKWYGDVVNINPCIFNFAVHVYEKYALIGLKLEGDEFKLFRESYEDEEQNGKSHFISGDIACHVGSIDEILKIAYADVV
jgi:hypothetical protein